MYSQTAHTTLPPRKCEPSITIHLREMSGYEGDESRQREEVSLGKRFWHWDADVILLYDLGRKKFDAKYGKVNEIKTSGTKTKVTLRSNNEWTYKVTRHGKENYSTNWYNWKEVRTVTY